METMTVVGLDLGYGYVKATNGEQDILFPAVVGDGFERTTMLGDVVPYEVVLETGQGRRHLFLGELAERECLDAIVNLSSRKHEDEDTEALVLTTLALLMRDEGDAHRVVTGLPLAHYALQKESLQQRLAHMQGAVTVEGRKLKVSAASVRVVPQAMGAMMAGLLDTRTLKPRDEALLRHGGYLLLVDIGTRTTGFVVFETRPFRYVESLSGSVDVGGHTFMQELSRLLGRVAGESPSLSDRALYQELLETGSVFFGGRMHTLTDEVDMVRQRVYTAVMREVMAKLGAQTLGKVQAVFLAGGAGAGAARYFQSHFARVEVLPDAQMANARGFRLFDLATELS
ncbi:ParM/StbA family protein [Alicyclobacillus tolerans]|uniref:Plasmid segregation protein ParM n=2 Tax=Alicyclobacillus tolerans TaxID=90970 RepID=A0ABT9LVM6_9BACL|nr:ParM/StbA family protein [Alicyclobacillus tengchongensis]MDP9728278.1 plasmid segregation protein ParM [Alicyclobacillus tengchongensis]